MGLDVVHGSAVAFVVWGHPQEVGSSQSSYVFRWELCDLGESVRLFVRGLSVLGGTSKPGQVEWTSDPMVVSLVCVVGSKPFME